LKLNTVKRLKPNFKIKAMSVSWKIFHACGVGNAVFIGATNIFYGIRGDYRFFKKSEISDNVFSKIAIIPAQLYISVCGIGIFTTCKSGYFYALGPIGTYRILLAFRNYVATNDKKWIKTLTHPGSCLSPSYVPYIIKPFGDASWIPK